MLDGARKKIYAPYYGFTRAAHIFLQIHPPAPHLNPGVDGDPQARNCDLICHPGGGKVAHYVYIGG